VTTQQEHSSKNGSLLGVFLAIAAAYFAREVLMPIAVAILFAFLLAPLANWLERMRLGRTAAALVAVFLGILVVSSLAYCLSVQFGEFGNQLPDYEQNIHIKLRQLGVADGGHIHQITKSLQEFRKDLTPTNAVSSTNSNQQKAANPPDQKAVPVEIRTPESSPFQVIRNVMGPFLNVLAKIFLVIVFCIFILSGRDDLRARLIRIAGPQNAKLTNQVLRDTAHRLSRYLLMQFVVNLTYAVPIGLGLWSIGIPNPFLWGMMAALLRYIPYAGPWIAALLPFAVGFAIGSDWTKPMLVLALFGVVEILTANFLEPFLYGNSTGITPLAVLVAAVFWTWLWGPAGLLLSMPLTVCLISIAKYVPQLELLDELFAERKK
jgi:predicted PurR-regulated permease PerM